MSASSNRLMVIILGLVTATVHLVLLNIGPDGIQKAFLVNGLGYFALLAAFAFKFPKGKERLVHLAFIGYTAVTIVAWLFLGKPYTILGYVTKTDEILLLLFLWLDLKRLPVAKS